MHKLEAPFLELGFYFADLSDADAFAKVARAILTGGAKFVGARGRRGPGERLRRFASPTDDPLRIELDLRGSQLDAALDDRDLRVMELQLDPIVGVSRSPEVLEYEMISEEASLVDHHPINILAEGHAYSGPHEPERGWNPGKKVYATFSELILGLRPSYACISVEAATHCPTDLWQDPRGFAPDFWVSRSYLGDHGIATIAKLFEGAYQEQLGDGVYVSTYQYWNPAKIGFDSIKAGHIATEVGKLIASRRPIMA